MPETKRKVDTVSTKTVVAEPQPEVRINRTRMQSLFPANVVYIGRISGERYIFPVAGAILEVDSRDVPDMLTYRIGTTGCCGGGNADGNTVFQII